MTIALIILAIVIMILCVAGIAQSTRISQIEDRLDELCRLLPDEPVWECVIDDTEDCA
jgi:ABC-type Fe3+ transport system permease subunit